MGIFHHNDKQEELPSGATFHPLFACVTMNESDLLRFLQFPKEDVDAIRSVLVRVWPKGIQSERMYHGAWEFKLHGYPWEGKGSDSVPARSLFCGVLEDLYRMGWVLVGSTDISKKEIDKDSLLFRRHGPSPPVHITAISFNETDKLRLINAPPDLAPAFRQMLGTMIQSEHDKDGALQFKMHGTPWFPDGGEAVTTRALLLNMLQTLEEYGFRLLMSVDQNSGPSGNDKSSSETDTWYVSRPQGWQSGMPVYSGLYGGGPPPPQGYGGQPPVAPYPGSPPPQGYPGSPPPQGYGAPGAYGAPASPYGQPGGYNPYYGQQ